MELPVEPLAVQSLKEACVSRLEQMILSGGLKIGERLPSERDFAARLGVSRPVLHEALVDLDAKGLVKIVPRRGVFVTDFRRAGSVAMLSSLLAYHNGQLDPTFIQSLMDMRILIEAETARLAALQRTPAQLKDIYDLLKAEAETDCGEAASLTELDFEFHLSIAIASANLIYPLIINSFNGVYTSMTGQFFKKYCNSPVVETVHQYHVQIVEFIDRQEAENAAQTMTEMLMHGERYLKGVDL